MHTVTAHGGGELIAMLQSIPRLQSRLSALPSPLRSAALQTRLSALPSLPCMSVRLFSGRMRGRHMRPRARARRCCRRGTQAHTSSGCAGQARAMGAHRGPTISAPRGARAQSPWRLKLACLLPSKFTEINPNSEDIGPRQKFRGAPEFLASTSRLSDFSSCGLMWTILRNVLLVLEVRYRIHSRSICVLILVHRRAY